MPGKTDPNSQHRIYSTELLDLNENQSSEQIKKKRPNLSLKIEVDIKLYIVIKNRGPQKRLNKMEDNRIILTR